MKIKLLAIGNVLMGDDGIAIYLADAMQEELTKMGIEVIYGETDVGYCMNCIKEEDYIIILDASDFGKKVGEVTRFSIDSIISGNKPAMGHSISFLDMLKLYMPKVRGEILGVQIGDIQFRHGISNELRKQFDLCIRTSLKLIGSINTNIVEGNVNGREGIKE